MNDELNPYPGNLKHHRVEPLLSDEQVLDLRSYPPEEIRDIYEAARAKDAKLIQRLVDALHGLQFDEGNIIPAYHKADKALDAAASAGFKPSDQ